MSGWVKMMRSEEADEVTARNPLAYNLASIIARRAWWRDGDNWQGCARGEAFLGDYTRYGMTRQQFRTALSNLRDWGFATFRTTNRGTIAKLTDTRLFTVGYGASPQEANQRDNQQPPTNPPLIRSIEDLSLNEGTEGKGCGAASAPSYEEVERASAEIGLPGPEARKFHSYHAARGWRSRGIPLVDWRQALVTWQCRWREGVGQS